MLIKVAKDFDPTAPVIVNPHEQYEATASEQADQAKLVRQRFSFVQLRDFAEAFAVNGVKVRVYQTPTEARVEFSRRHVVGGDYVKREASFALSFMPFEGQAKALLDHLGNQVRG
jgi:hypothetical protein